MILIFRALSLYAGAIGGPFASSSRSQGRDIIDAQDIVRPATSTMQADWAAAPGFAFVQRDVTTSKGTATRKTHQVFMIAGSDYYMPIAIDDQPIPRRSTLPWRKKGQSTVTRRMF